MISTTEAPATGLSALLRVKAQLHRDMAWLQASLHNPAEVADLEHRLIRGFTDDYLPALDDLIASSDPTQLRARLDQLNDEMDASLLSATSDAGDKHFKTLLLEHEVLHDALMVGARNAALRPLPVFLDRIAGYRAALVTEPSPAPAHAREAQP